MKQNVFYNFRYFFNSNSHNFHRKMTFWQVSPFFLAASVLLRAKAMDFFLWLACAQKCTQPNRYVNFVFVLIYPPLQKCEWVSASDVRLLVFTLTPNININQIFMTINIQFRLNRHKWACIIYIYALVFKIDPVRFSSSSRSRPFVFRTQFLLYDSFQIVFIIAMTESSQQNLSSAPSTWR